MYVFIKLNEKSSLYKALKQRDIIDYRGYIPLTLDFLPRVGESFVLPYGKLSGNKCNETLKKYLTYSLHSLPGDISVWIITFADRIMIDKYKGHADTGLYSIGYKLGQSPEILFHSINKAYVPYVYNKYSDF